MRDRRPILVDAGLYAASALFALVVALTWSIPLQRHWGRTAMWGYGVGAVAALMAAAAWGRIREPSRTRIRVALCALVFALSALLPLSREVLARQSHPRGPHAQSETLITEEAAKALLRGEDPYSANYLHGPLASWPIGAKTHVPYLPGILLFGLPRALLGAHPWTDARVWFLGIGMLAAAAALALTRPPPGRAVLAAQVLWVLPTGAPYITGGGDDVTVLAVMLLSLALLSRRRPTEAGAVAGLAAAVKQTAWPLAPFLVLAARRGDGRPARGRALGAWAVVVGGFVVPFAVRDPGAMWEDVVRFPLGLGKQPTLAGSPTLGRLLRDVVPGPDVIVTAAGMAVVIGVAVYLAARRTPETAGRAARSAAVVLTLAILLATAGRFGYLLYPIGLAVWSSSVFGSRGVRGSRAPPAPARSPGTAP